MPQLSDMYCILQLCFTKCYRLPTGKPQRPGRQVRLRPGYIRQAVLWGEGGAGEEDRLWEVPQHQPLRVRDTLHAVGQETRRGGGAVQAEECAHKYMKHTHSQKYTWWLITQTTEQKPQLVWSHSWCCAQTLESFLTEQMCFLFYFFSYSYQLMLP